MIVDYRSTHANSLKLRVCLHNAIFVHRIENGDDPEFKQTYEQNNLWEEKCNDEVKNKVYREILEEDLFFKSNKQNLNLNSDKIDLELLEM